MSTGQTDGGKYCRICSCGMEKSGRRRPVVHHLRVLGRTVRRLMCPYGDGSERKGERGRERDEESESYRRVGRPLTWTEPSQRRSAETRSATEEL